MKYIKIFIVVFTIIALGVFITLNILSEGKPEGQEGAKAEALTEKMFDAINYEAWDTTRYVSWVYKGKNQYLWDKAHHRTRVAWGNYIVYVDLNHQRGQAYENNQPLKDKENRKVVRKAWKRWVNDAFWLNAPAKAKDPGTVRKYVDLDGPEEGLFVEYTKGGHTPGDSYLWILDKNGLPKAWKVWVKIIPIDGLQFTWDDWITTGNGAKFATTHESWLGNINISQVKMADSISAFTDQEKQIFQSLIPEERID